MSETQADLVECPICNSSYEATKINAHVDKCLTKSEKKCKTRNETRESRPSSPPDDQTSSHQQNGATQVEKYFDLKNAKTCSPENVENVSQPMQNGSSTSKLKDETIYKKPKKSLSDILGKLNKRNFPKDVDSPVNERKKLKMSPSSTSPSSTTSSKLSSFAIRKASHNQNIANLDHQTNNDKDSIQKPFGIAKSELKQEINLAKGIPLAEQLRPKSFEEYFGQNEAIGDSTSIRLLLESGKIPSVILWGPPGCGKTSLVNVITTTCKKNQQKRVVKLSATTSGINDVKEAVKVAKNELTLFKRETVLFIDEIHRFNKLQQDFFLPHVENGTITLIGATTENPSFHVNSSLLSRCKVVVLKKHTNESICQILERAVSKLGGTLDLDKASSSLFRIEKDALEMLANLCDGDARRALNALEMAVNTIKNNEPQPTLTSEHINAVLQRNHVIYDKNGEEHYNIISALHKSIRGSDDSAALYWLARMLEGGEDPLYVARRLVRIASEDIGLADSTALTKATAAFQACHFVGMPECDVILAHVVVYLARAPKSIEVYKAYNAAKRLVKGCKGPLPGVPLHLRNAPTRLMKELDYGKGYKYNPDYDEPVEQDYFPKELIGTNLFSD